MAVIVRSNLCNLLVFVFLIAAYSSEVRAKPTTESPTEKGIASNDLDKTTKPTPTQPGFFINFEPQEPVQKIEEPKKIKPVQKKVEGSTEKSKSKNESSDEKKSKKNKLPIEDAVPENNYEEKSGWDLAGVLDKDDDDYSAEANVYTTVDNVSSSKDKATTSSKKSKVSSKSEPPTTESGEDSEPLPSAQGQKSRLATTLRPTTTSTTEHSTGSASTNLPRALCSFVVTIATVMLVL